MSEIEKFLEQLKKNRYSQLNPSIDAKQAILLQRELNDNGFSKIPENFLQLLHTANGMSCDSAVVLGTFSDDPLRDIVSQNIRFETNKDTLILGLSEMDLFVYKPQKKVYQILDRDDAAVLEEYAENDLLKALSVFLKMRNE